MIFSCLYLFRLFYYNLQIGLKQGLEMLSIFKSYAAKTSLLDDFNFYENRAKSIHSQSSKPSSQQNEIYSNGDIPVSLFITWQRIILLNKKGYGTSQRGILLLLLIFSQIEAHRQFVQEGVVLGSIFTTNYVKGKK